MNGRLVMVSTIWTVTGLGMLGGLRPEFAELECGLGFGEDFDILDAPENVPTGCMRMGGPGNEDKAFVGSVRREA